METMDVMGGGFGEESSGLSLNLLGESPSRNNSGVLATPSSSGPTASVLTAKLIEKIVKNAQEPLKEDIKAMRKDLATMTKKVISMENCMQNVGKQSREILTSVDQKKGNLSTLLTQIGAITIKSRCFLNLDLDANEATEHELLDTFFDEAKEYGWLTSDTDKSVKDIKIRFREERNILKQQVKRKLIEDFSNSSVEHAVQLSRTRSYLMKHIGELNEEVNLHLHHLAFIMGKYLNSKKKMVESSEKEIQKLAQSDLFGYLQKRSKV